LRRLGKHNEDYQRDAPRRIVEFPAGACWIAITDLVLHGALSGQHSLDQTFFLPAAAMRDPSRSSLRILERLSGRRLV
jgi:3-deoxy-D-manno-oct-2-ulosonic acid (Kdo) hydroxylase